MLKKFRNILLLFFQLVVLIYILILIFLYFYQRNLLYHPNENNYSGDHISVNIKKIKVKTNDDIELLGWYHEKDVKRYKTILFFHGNAGTLENRIHKLNHFQEMDVNFLIIAWRGFSGNKGSPTEKGLYEDGKSAINWLIDKGIKEENIILYGESLGTGVATHLSQNKNFAGVILETPFTSMIDAAKNFYPYIPVGLLLKDKFDNKSKIRNISVPILIMHGEIDQIVPYSMGKKIYEIANEPKFSYFTKHDNHMMVYDENLVKTLKSFLKNLN
tara:strand:+ start:1381 stop:2199 length:819 start_codon:yes stop_codon:yes gene_type:complete